MANEINTISEWNEFAVLLHADGYTVFQMQYAWYDSEGFNAWFWASKKPTIHVVTHSKEIHEAIVKY